MKKVMIFTVLCLHAATWAGAQDYQNLILNPAAQTLTLENWQIVANGGDGWTVFDNSGADNTPCFATSYDWDIKSQTIDLVAHGYSTVLLDNEPTILFSVKYCGEGNGSSYSDLFELYIELRDASGEVIDSFNSGTLTCTDEWQTIKGSFRNYGPGLRSIYYEDAGKDVNFWAGHYGAKIDDAWLSIVNHLYYADAGTGSLSGWEVTENGGDGWLVDGTYRTSFENDTKHQLIDLVGLGYTPEELDSQPYIYAGEWSVGFWPDYEDYYWLNVNLLDESMEIIDQYNLNTTVTQNWLWNGAEFKNYGPGLRYIYFEHGGHDEEWWLGNYGTVIDNALVDIVLNSTSGIGNSLEDGTFFVSVYPNPAVDHFTVKLSQGRLTNVKLTICELSGKIVYSESLGDLQNQVCYKNMVMSSLLRGIYLVKIDCDQGSQTTRLIIQ